MSATTPITATPDVRPHLAASTQRPDRPERVRAPSDLEAAHHRLAAECEATGHTEWTCEHAHQLIAIGRIAEQRLRPRIGYLRLATPRLRMLHINARTGIGPGYDDADAARVLLHAIQQGMADRTIHGCSINRVEVGSTLATAIDQQPMRIVTTRTVPCWRCELTDESGGRSFPLRGKTLRKRRNESRRLAEALGPIELSTITQRHQVDRFLTEADRLTKASYHASLGVGVRANALWRNMFTAEAMHGRLRAYMLRAAGVPLAYVSGVLEQSGLYHFEATSFDPTHRSLSPGGVLLWHVVQDLYEHTDTRCIDFGYGDAHYKRIYATRGHTETNILLLGSSLPACVTAGVCRASTRLHEYCCSIPGAGRIKRLWRCSMTGARR